MHSAPVRPLLTRDLSRASVQGHRLARTLMDRPRGQSMQSAQDLPLQTRTLMDRPRDPQLDPHSGLPTLELVGSAPPQAPQTPMEALRDQR